MSIDPHDQRLPEQADVVIIGAGIAGSTAAYELAKRGLDVVVLERARVAAEQSGRNAGFVRAQGRLVQEIPMALDSIKMFSEFATTYGQGEPDFHRDGNLMVTSSPQTLKLYEHWLDAARDHDVDSRLVTPSEIKQIVPKLRGEWKGGLYAPHDAQANPREITQLVADAAGAIGVRIIEGITVEHIDVEAGQVSGVVTNRGRVKAPNVVVAAGIHSTFLLRALGLKLPVKLVRNSAFSTHPVAPITTTALLLDGTFTYRQDSRGVVYGQHLRSDVDLTRDAFKDMKMFLPMYLKNFRSFFPQVNRDTFRSFKPARHRDVYEVAEPPVRIASVRQGIEYLNDILRVDQLLVVDRVWPGVIDGTVDGLPVIDALDSPRGLVVATGQSGHGFGIGPATGRAVAELITEGRSRYDLSAFTLHRFRDGTYAEPYNLI